MLEAVTIVCYEGVRWLAERHKREVEQETVKRHTIVGRFCCNQILTFGNVVVQRAANVDIANA